MNDADPNPFEPLSWLLVFQESTGRRWLDRIIPGRFKHVFAIAYLSEPDLWLFYSVSMRRTVVSAIPAPAGEQVADRHMAGATVLRMTVQPGSSNWGSRIGFFCVPAMKHLVGLRSGALLASTFYRHCLRAGAEILSDGSRYPGFQAEQV